MTSDWTTGDATPHDGHGSGDAEWAWFADAYRKVPEPRPEAVAVAVHAAQASAVTWHVVRTALRWLLGTTAGIGLVVAGYSLAKSYGPAPAASRSAPAAEARPMPDSEPAAPSPAVDTTPAPVPAPTPLPTAPIPPLPPPATKPMPADVPPTPAAPTAGQQPKTDSTGAAELDQLGLTRLRTVLGESQLRRLNDLVHEADRAGIPSALLLDCVEKYGKETPASLILEGIERRFAALRSVRAVLGPNATKAELAAGADAIEADVPTLLVESIWWHAPPGRAAAGLAGLAGLVTHGVPAPAAAEAIFHYFGADASDDDLSALGTDVAADIARGIPPLVALRARVERFTSTPTPAVTPAPEP